jgi:crotonobetainyl-CoA:carnitine CoA-transferase CaiB-like acyl-CoA transferase
VGALAAMAGLMGRRRTGRGLVAEAAQFETALGMLGDILAAESLERGSVHPQGNSSTRGAPWGCYPCAGDDAWCVVCVRDDEAWRGLRSVLGDPDWSADPTHDTTAGRLARRSDLDAELAAWTSKRPAREVMETLQAAGMAAGIVAHGGDLLEDPHLVARGFAQWVEQPGIGRVAFEGTPFRGSDLPAPVVKHAPWLGEHTRELAREKLGLSDAEIEALVADGVLEDPPDGPPSNQ